MKVLLLFRSGAQVAVDVDRLEVVKAAADGGRPERFEALRWADAVAGDRPLGILPSEVVAAIELGATAPPIDEPAPVPARHTYRRLYQPDTTHPNHPGVECADYEATEVTP